MDNSRKTNITITKTLTVLSLLFLTFTIIQIKKSKLQIVLHLLSSTHSILPSKLPINRAHKIHTEHISNDRPLLSNHDFNFWIRDYHNWTCIEKKKKKHRKLVLALTANGLGDQFRTILRYYMLARITSRVLYIKPLPPLQLHDIFNTSVTQQFQILRKHHIKCRYVDDRQIGANESMKLLYSRDDVCFKGKTILKTGKSYWEEIGRGYELYCKRENTDTHEEKCENISHQMSKLSGVTTATFRGIYRHLFQFSDDVRLIYKKIVAKHNLCADDELLPEPMEIEKCHRFVTVHARIGIGVNEGSDDRFRIVNTNMESVARNMIRVSLHRALKLGLGNNDDGRIRIYLATDTEQFRPVFDKAAMKISKRVIVIHGEKSVHVAKISRNQREEEGKYIESFQKVVGEMMVIGSGEDIVSISSGFSSLAFGYGRGCCLLHSKSWREDTCEEYLNNNDNVNYAVKKIH